MKFMMALIYALAAALLMGLLGVYFYFSVVQRQSSSPNDETIANIALLLFVIAVLVFSMILVWLENLPDETSGDSLEKYINDVKNEKIENTGSSAEWKFVLQRLNQISQSLSMTNKTLNLGLERLSTRIDEVENASLDQVINNKPVKDDAQLKSHPKAAQEQTTEQPPELSKIFNDELAQTLSGLEIMQDKPSWPQTAKDIIDETDLDALLSKINKK